MVVRRFNRVVDVARAGAANVGVGVGAGARIIGSIATDDVLHAFTLRIQLAAVDGIGGGVAYGARCQTADLVAGTVNFHTTYIHGVKGHIFGGRYGVDGLAVGTGGAGNLDVITFFNLGFGTRRCCFHITNIRCVGGGGAAAGYVANNFAASIDAVFSHTRTAANLEASIRGDRAGKGRRIHNLHFNLAVVNHSFHIGR